MNDNKKRGYKGGIKEKKKEKEKKGGQGVKVTKRAKKNVCFIGREKGGSEEKKKKNRNRGRGYLK